MNEQTLKKWLELIEKWPDRAQACVAYASRREWRRAWKRHGKVLGISREDMKDFCLFCANSKDAESYVSSPKGQKIEKTQDDAGDMSVLCRGIRVKSLEDLIKAAEIDLDTWRVSSWTSNTWEVAARNSKGNIEVTPVFQVKAKLERKRYSEHVAAQPIKTRKRTRPSIRRDGMQRAVFVPDTQHGFRWSKGHSYLEPLHDRVAIDAVIQLCQVWQPDVICMLGDMADFAPWSTRFPRDPSLRQTTQPTINELHWMLSAFRSVCPSSRIVYLAGNHEDRLKRAQVELLDESVGLHPANEPAGSPDVLSIERLLALDSLDIEWVGDYDTGFWLWDKVRVCHGTTVRNGGGATVASVVKGSDYSSVFGHIHRVELAQRLVHGPGGRRTITAMSPGTLCRVEPGIVPAATKLVDWQQGVGLGLFDEETNSPHMWVVPIYDGRLAFDGNIIQGIDRTEEIAEATGFMQMIAR